MAIEAKTAQTIIDEFNNPIHLIDSNGKFKIENDEIWLRSAMRSLLQQAIKEIPEIRDGGDSWADGYDAGTRDSIFAIEELQKLI